MAMRRFTVAFAPVGLAVMTACSPPPAGRAPDGGVVVAAAGPALAAGAAHACAIFGDGAVRCWGDNAFGQLGRAGSPDPLAGYSVDLGTGRRASGIYAGTSHTCAILDGGDLKCWGDNANGQLGLEDTVNRGDGLSAMGDGLPVVNLGAGQRAIAVAAGDGATCALLDTHRIKCWGNAYQGALGYGDNLTRGTAPGSMGDNLPTVDLGSRDGVPFAVKAIAPVDYHSFCAVLDETGPDNSALKCWGSNDYCELALGTHDGGRGATPDSLGNSLPFVDLGQTAAGAARKAIALAGGYQFICALGDDGAVVCWGDNLAGQLGLGFTGAPRSCDPTETGGADVVPLPGPAVAIAARGTSDGGGAHICALIATGAVVCWGENGSGQLGTGDTKPLSSPSAPLAFPDGFVPTELVLGYDISCARSADGGVKCWGSDADGLLGPPIDMAGDRLAPGPDARWFGRPVSALAAGDDHTCAIFDSGALACWGRNQAGQLGLGDTVDRGSQPDQLGSSLPDVDLGGASAIAVAAGAAHTCAVTDGGDVRCWGDNGYGQLGTGDQVALTRPPVTPVALGTQASAAAAGAGFSCALSTTGQVACWGDNAHGQLGAGDATPRSAPAPAVRLPAKAIAIAAGDDHACALLADGRIACWGANAHGQLGVGDTEDRNTPTLTAAVSWSSAAAIAARADETCLVTRAGSVVCWGDNTYGQLGLGDVADRSTPGGPIDLGSARTAALVSTGGGFTCARLDGAAVKCWGDNRDAALGAALTGPAYGDEPNEMGDSLPTVFQGGGRSVRSVTAGRAHVCVVLDTGDVRCWGDNRYGQLGVGDAAAHSWYSQPTGIVDLGPS